MNYYNYFTEIEEHFVRRRGKHLYISPLDWSLIEVWRDSGVPLNVALRGIDRAMDSYYAQRSRPESRVSTLFYCHASVMEEYARHLEAHVGEEATTSAKAASAATRGHPAPEEGPDKKSVVAHLNGRIAEIKALSAKLHESEDASEGIDRAVMRLEEIARDVDAGKQLAFEALERDLTILDEDLVEVLRGTISQELLTGWDQEAKKELKIYRKKLPKNTFEKILENYRRTRIHQHFGMGELSLFHM